MGWHLEGAGIGSVLVGGAVVAIHTEGLYRSGDLDLVPDHFDGSKLKGCCEGLALSRASPGIFVIPSALISFLNSRGALWRSARNFRSFLMK